MSRQLSFSLGKSNSLNFPWLEAFFSNSLTFAWLEKVKLIFQVVWKPWRSYWHSCIHQHPWPIWNFTSWSMSPKLHMAAIAVSAGCGMNPEFHLCCCLAWWNTQAVSTLISILNWSWQDRSCQNHFCIHTSRWRISSKIECTTGASTPELKQNWTHTWWCNRLPGARHCWLWQGHFYTV